MIILSATVRIMKNICDIFMKTLCGGIMTNYMPKNRGVGFALCLCYTKAKLAINRIINKNLLNGGVHFEEKVYLVDEA